MHRPPRGPSQPRAGGRPGVKFTPPCIPADPDPATPRPAEGRSLAPTLQMRKLRPGAALLPAQWLIWKQEVVPGACLLGCSSGIVAGPTAPLPRPPRLPPPASPALTGCQPWPVGTPDWQARVQVPFSLRLLGMEEGEPGGGPGGHRWARTLKGQEDMASRGQDTRAGGCGQVPGRSSAPAALAQRGQGVPSGRATRLRRQGGQRGHGRSHRD